VLRPIISQTDYSPNRAIRFNSKGVTLFVQSNRIAVRAMQLFDAPQGGIVLSAPVHRCYPLAIVANATATKLAPVSREPGASPG
jgi:hypothetical protein